VTDDAATIWAARTPISVVIPTRNRPDALSRCLDALAAQTITDELEVIVVDDASLEPSAVAAVVARHPRARLIQGEGEGPASARNAGGRAAHGSFLCFTDDDCEPRRDWAERLVEALDAGADAASGTVLSPGGALSEASETVARAAARVRAGTGSALPFAASGNLACTRSTLEKVPFDEKFPHPAGEDREWSTRVVAAGFVLRFEPAACVVHHQELTLSRFLRQQIRYGEGAYRFRRLGDARLPLEGPGFYLGLVRDGFRQGVGVGALVCLAQAATAVGYFRARAEERRNAIVSAATAGPSASRAHDLRARSGRRPPT
jgi:GT2 family glycosyltransferase